MEPAEPSEVGEDKAWTDGLVGYARGRLVWAYTHAIALHRVDDRSLWGIGERRRPMGVVIGVGGQILCRGCGRCRRGRWRSDLGRTQSGCRHTMLQSIGTHAVLGVLGVLGVVAILAILRVCLALVLGRWLTCVGATTAVSAQLCQEGRHCGSWQGAASLVKLSYHGGYERPWAGEVGGWGSSVEDA